MTTFRKWPLILIVLGAGAAFCCKALRMDREGDRALPPAQHENEENEEEESGADLTPDVEQLGGIGYLSVGISVWREDGFLQELFGTDFHEFAIVDNFLEPVSGDWVRIPYRGVTEYYAFETAWAHKDAYCFAGVDYDRNFVLERWRLLPGSEAPSVPVSGTPGSLIQVPYVAAQSKTLERVEIYRGPLNPNPKVYSVEFDFEERFIMCLVGYDDDCTLYRFENVEQASPQIVASSDTIPELAAMRYLKKADHAILGRVWHLDGFVEYQILYVDSDNDGVFDGPPLVGDSQFFESLGLMEYQDWDFMDM